MLRTLLGYLAQCDERRPLLAQVSNACECISVSFTVLPLVRLLMLIMQACVCVQVLRAVCQAWSNSSAVKHTTVEQQLYVSKALLLCLSLSKPQEIEQQQQGNTHNHAHAHTHTHTYTHTHIRTHT